ncbi:hypothetical protein [Acidovorax sp.]|uniref:hypothetical protein n=1 Tax=Acidovorax sp. TaxID=1872122 RepID=UPI0025C0B850|nr:hypothetical protein [Acidovorax sp.]
MTTKKQTQTPMPTAIAGKLAATALTLVVGGLLAACGGGGGGSGPTIDPAQLKGRWVTAAGVAPAMTAVVVPDVNGAANAWLLAQDASRLVKLVVRSDSSANGKTYALGQGNAIGQAVTGQVNAALTASPKTIAFTGLNTTGTLTQSDALATPAVQAEVQGSWSATLGGNAQTVQWSLAATGGLTGSSTTGCTYVGSVAAIASTAAYSVSFNESCADGSKTAFGGVGTLNAAKNGLTVVVASADESRGAALFLAK